MKRSIRLKLTLWFTGSMCLLIIVFFAFTFFTFQHAIYKSDMTAKLDAELVRYAGQIRQQISTSHGPFYVPLDRYRDLFDGWIGESLFLNPVYGQLTDFPDTYGQPTLIMIKCRELGNRAFPLSGEAYRTVAEGGHMIETVRGVFPYPVRVVTIDARDMIRQRYVLQVGMSMQPVNTTLASVLLRFALAGPLVVFIVSLFGYFFVKRSFAPVRDLVKVARDITAEDLSRRIPPIDSSDEIGELATTLNDMIARLESSFNEVRQFSGDVSHELRTPLTVIKGEIEVALRSGRSGDEYRSTLASVLEETDKLNSIIEDLLLLSRIDAQGKSIAMRDVELDGVVMEAYEEALVIAGGKKLNISIAALDEATVRGEAGLLKRVFVNLIHNAVKYTPQGGSVELKLVAGGEDGIGAATFIIKDTGIGISRRHLPNIFNRFYRVSASRSPQTGGKGLGLTIVKRILELHGAAIAVDSRPGSGTAFTVVFRKN